jgi:spore coat protein CotH
MNISRYRYRLWAIVSLAMMSGMPSSRLTAQPPGGPNAPDVKLVDEFDANGDGWLNGEERKAALAELKAIQAERGDRRRGPGGRRGGPGGRGGSRPAGSPGPEVSPADVQSHGDAGLYDTDVLRTLFIEFEDDDWEEQMAAFKPTDVEIPATLTVDGKTYPQVGMSFRGSSSFFMIPSGSKRSLNLSIDFIDDDQRLYDYKSLNLLNCNGDASMMSSLLYSHIAGQKIATPKVNFVKVVINGRSWGIYSNSQQFNKDFVKENFDTKKGARWKVSGNPNGDAGLRYLGDELEPYRQRFEIKSKDREEPWNDLVSLCRLLNETAPKNMEKVLSPVLDLDGVLWFLAVDVALVNSDGYWTRASDYNMYQNKDGMFHILPHDMNEAFHDRQGRGGPGGGPGGPGGRPGFGPPGFGPPPEGNSRDRRPPPDDSPNANDRPRDEQRRRGDGPQGERGPREQGQGGRGDRQGEGRGFGPPPGFGPPGEGRGFGGPGFGGPRGPRPSVDLDPLVGLDSDRFPLRSKLLANEALRTRYLQYVRLIAKEYLNWKHLGPRVASARKLIQAEVKSDTRKLTTDDAFQQATDNRDGELRKFCEKRADYLLELDVIKQLPEELVELTSAE